MDKDDPALPFSKTLKLRPNVDALNKLNVDPATRYDLREIKLPQEA
jgi:hypothetical protein